MRSLALLASALMLASLVPALAWELPGIPPDTSRQAVTPPWAFQLWMWEDDVNTPEAVWDIVNGCEKHDLPLGAVLLDSPWATAYNNFIFDERRYPNSQKMIDDLHARGLKVILWMTCMVNTREGKADAPGEPSEDLYAIAKEKGYLCNDGKPVKWWKGVGGFVDYTNPGAVEWWHGLMDRALKMGVDGWKVDGAAELFPLSGGFGKRGPISLLEYMDLYYRDTYFHLISRNPEGVTMVRSVDPEDVGYTGRHAPRDAAPITWVGDQKHDWTDQGLLEALSSCFYAMDHGYASIGSDSAGYSSTGQGPLLPRTLFLRWVQWNAFMPFLINGGHEDHRPWSYDEDFLRIFRKFAWMHNELVPFFYSYVRRAHETGEVFLRPMPGTWQYALGNEMLAAPIYEDSNVREVRIPEGRWLDYWEPAIAYDGPVTIQVRVPEDRFPVYVRSGSIVPLDVRNEYGGHGSRASAGALTLDIYPDPQRTAAFNLWQHGGGLTEITCAAEDGSTVVTIIGQDERGYILRVHAPAAPSAVDVLGAESGAALPELSEEQWESGAAGWRYDAAGMVTCIRLSPVKGTVVLRLR